MVLISSANAIIAVSQHGNVIEWDILTGAFLGDQVFAYTSPHDNGANEPTVKAPHVASLSADACPGISLGRVRYLEIESGEVIAWPRDGYKKLPPVLLFNSNCNISLLLVVHTDNELALCEIDTRVLVRVQETPSTARIISAFCSPDGRTPATVDNQGAIQI